MANFSEVYNNEGTVFQNLNHNQLDYFFTQRKVVEYDEFITNDMKRSKKKITKNYNFLAINFPLNITKELNGEIDMELWGDKGYNYTGKIISKRGEIPHLLIRLSGDTQIFIKLLSLNNKKNETIIGFIQIPKRYQNIIDENTKTKRLQKSEKSDNLDV